MYLFEAGCEQICQFLVDDSSIILEEIDSDGVRTWRSTLFHSSNCITIFLFVIRGKLSVFLLLNGPGWVESRVLGKIILHVPLFLPYYVLFHHWFLGYQSFGICLARVS